MWFRLNEPRSYILYCDIWGDHLLLYDTFCYKDEQIYLIKLKLINNIFDDT